MGPRNFFAAASLEIPSSTPRIRIELIRTEGDELESAIKSGSERISAFMGSIPVRGFAGLTTVKKLTHYSTLRKKTINLLPMLKTDSL